MERLGTMNYFAPLQNAMQGAQDVSNQELANAYKMHEFETKQKAAKLLYEKQKLEYDAHKRLTDLQERARQASAGATQENPAYRQYLDSHTPEALSVAQGQTQPTVQDFSGGGEAGMTVPNPAYAQGQAQLQTANAPAPAQTQAASPAMQIKMYIDAIAKEDPMAAMEAKSRLTEQILKLAPTPQQGYAKINEVFGEGWVVPPSKKDLTIVPAGGRVIDASGNMIADNPKDATKGFDTIDMGNATKVIPRDGSEPYIVPKAARPDTVIKVAAGGSGGGGKPPAGYRYTPDGNLEAIPGGPADQKQETKRQADAGATAVIDETIGTIDKLLAHPGRKAGTGLSSKLDPRNYVPGTNASDFRKELESFDSKLFLANVAKMKGMGALSDKEGAKISAAAGAIKPGMSEAAFESNMRTIRVGLEEARKRIGLGSAPPAGRKTSADPMGIL